MFFNYLFIYLFIYLFLLFLLSLHFATNFLGVENHDAELLNVNSGSNSNQVAAQDGDGSQTDITPMYDPVYKAAAKGDMTVLAKKISEFQLQLSPKHNTILHIASEFGQIECVKWILRLPSCSSLLQRPNMKEDTPLHLAAREGHSEVVKALLEAAKKPPVDIETSDGVDKKMLIRMTNKEKNTALHEAVRFEHSDVVELLIEEDPGFLYGANDSGMTPLYMAAERGFTGLVKLIIDKSVEAGTSPPYTGFMCRTALHAAVICNDQGSIFHNTNDYVIPSYVD